MLLTGRDGSPLFASRRIFGNFVLIVLCSQFAYALLAMKGALLPQLLELWQVSKSEFGLLMSIYGASHTVLYVALSWAQDRIAPRVLISANLILGGFTTFFLGQTSDFYTLCFLFVMLSIWCEGAFWPAIVASVRRSTSDTNQGKIFGLLEGGRGIIELAQNSLTVALYAWLSYSVLGLKVAFAVNAGIMVILGVLTWFFLPRETLLKSGHQGALATREVIAGMRATLTMPEVWLAGLAGFAVYITYTTLPYYLTLLDDLYALPALAIAVFGVVSTSTGRISMAFPAGFIAERFLGGPSGGMALGLTLVSAVSLLTILVTLSFDAYLPVMALLMVLAFAFFFMRPLYFAPFGEMGLPPRFSGSVIAVASFVIYLPSAFAYGLWGWMLDAYPGATGYQLMFACLIGIGLVGALIAWTLKRRIASGAAERIAIRIQALDERLGLEGDERRMA